MGMAASCIQAAEFYFGKRRRQTKSELNEPEAFSSTVLNVGQASKFSFSMTNGKVRWSAPVKFVKVMLVSFMIFMCLAWLVNVGFLICILLQKFGPPAGEWTMFEFILICWIAVLAVTAPIQFVQIFRMWRALSEKSKDTSTVATLR
jgi:hypothetical protein